SLVYKILNKSGCRACFFNFYSEKTSRRLYYMKLAIVGATGVVGTKMIEMVEQYEIPFDELVLFSSKRSSGKKLTVKGETYIVQELTEEKTADGFDYVIMSAGGSTSEKFAPLFEQSGAIVIDNSSFWRMHEDIDLIVPEINAPL